MKAPKLMYSNFLLIILFFISIRKVLLQKQSSNNGENNNPSVYNIGGVLSGNESEAHFETTISVILFFFLELIL